MGFIDLMEKYEAAQRNLTAALEKRVKELEKKVPRFDVDLKR
jgi:polyhydroxyalkanoate synthesis regulator phasin